MIDSTYFSCQDLNIRQWRRSVEFKWAIEISFAGHKWIVYMLINLVGHPVVAGKAEGMQEQQFYLEASNGTGRVHASYLRDSWQLRKPASAN